MYRGLAGRAEIKAAALKPDAEILTSRLSSSLKRDETPTTHYGRATRGPVCCALLADLYLLALLSSPSFRFSLPPFRLTRGTETTWSACPIEPNNLIPTSSPRAFASRIISTILSFPKMRKLFFFNLIIYEIICDLSTRERYTSALYYIFPLHLLLLLILQSHLSELHPLRINNKTLYCHF